MYRIIDDRGTGKTSRLMLLAKENDAVFVCNNPDAMRWKAQQYGIDGINFISYHDFTRCFDPEVKNYVVDELEYFVKSIISGPKMIGYTLSKND
jgi:hypothetical protein